MKWNVKTVVLMAATAALVAALIVWLQSSEPAPKEPAPALAQTETARPVETEAPGAEEEAIEEIAVAPTEPETPPPDAETRPVTTTIVPRTPAPPPVVVEETAEPPSGTMPLRSDEILATVNGVQITGRDVLLFGEAHADKPQHVSAEALDHLLNQAINRVLIYQAAESAGVELTGDQRMKLAQIREEVEARVNAPWMGNLKDTGTIEERVEFERRASESDMLLSNLLAQRGINVPDATLTDDDVESLYKERAGEFGPLPDDPAARAEAWKDIEFRIRDRRAHELISQYKAEGRKLIEELRSRASIHIVTKSP